MTDQSGVEPNPADYMSEDPAQQNVGDTRGGMESLASYEDGGDEQDLIQSGSKDDPTRKSAVPNDLADAGIEPGTGSSMTDSLSNSGNSV